MRWFRGAMLAAMALLIAACPTAATKTDVTTEEPETQVLEPADSVTFDFPADGLWHPSPFQALNGQQLVIRPIGAAAGFEAGSIQFKIGRYAQIAHASRPFGVTQPGRIEFRVDPQCVQKHKGLISVQVDRIE